MATHEDFPKGTAAIIKQFEGRFFLSGESEEVKAIIAGFVEDLQDLPEETVYKDAETGQFVSKEYADANPTTTFQQTVRKLP